MRINLKKKAKRFSAAKKINVEAHMFYNYGTRYEPNMEDQSKDGKSEAIPYLDTLFIDYRLAIQVESYIKRFRSLPPIGMSFMLTLEDEYDFFPHDFVVLESLMYCENQLVCFFVFDETEEEDDTY
ncbi:MAG: hypothetical protein WCR72_11095 [Bacteroidota bacterium]